MMHLTGSGVVDPALVRAGKSEPLGSWSCHIGVQTTEEQVDRLIAKFVSGLRQMASASRNDPIEPGSDERFRRTRDLFVTTLDALQTLAHCEASGVGLLSLRG